MTSRGQSAETAPLRGWDVGFRLWVTAVSEVTGGIYLWNQIWVQVQKDPREWMENMKKRFQNKEERGGERGLDPWVQNSPWQPRGWQPTLVFLPGKSHGQRSLAGYSPWGPKNQTGLSDYTTTTTAGNVMMSLTYSLVMTYSGTSCVKQTVTCKSLTEELHTHTDL